MKIALVANCVESVPPLGYSGIEWIVYFLASGLGKKGHQVDLYASGNSRKEDSYNLIPITKTHIRGQSWFEKDYKQREVEIMMTMSKVASQINQRNYDIVHNHVDRVLMYFANFINQKIVTTCHSALSPDYRRIAYLDHKDYPYVSISYNQRRDCPDLNFVANIYHGIDIDQFHFNEHETENNNDYMAFLARMVPEKGVLEAAQIAHKLKKKLLIAAKVDPITDIDYYDQVKKYFDNQFCIFKGEIKSQERISFLGNARCLISPIKWEEPFGLIFTEAMSTGTPVVAFARGSVPEIIKDGETGFIVNSSPEDIRGDWIIKKTGMEGLLEAVEKVYSMNKKEYEQMRLNCRKHVEDNFTVEKMVENYENVYNKILAKTL
ncbi:glycosyltransferase family 4 protein [Candidatus Parcubacteria bacterium]|nr:MAG: glycosyltransferase family 4 protein [Candidatus Parcubacteria bacterium]